MGLEIHVDGRQIIVNKRHSRYAMTYIRQFDTPSIIEDPLRTRDEEAEEFRSRVWQAAKGATDQLDS
jgi:hypothetical protein